MQQNSNNVLTSDEVWSLCKLGYQLYARERYDQAEQLFRGIVTLNDGVGYAWHVLGLIARKRGDVQGAVDSFQKHLNLDPDEAASRVYLAETLYENGYRSDAVDVLRQLDVDDEEPSQAGRRGRVLLKRWTSATS